MSSLFDEDEFDIATASRVLKSYEAKTRDYGDEIDDILSEFFRYASADKPVQKQPLIAKPDEKKSRRRKIPPLMIWKV